MRAEGSHRDGSPAVGTAQRLFHARKPLDAQGGDAGEWLDSTNDPAQQAQYLLFYDELTGLYNRRFYNRKNAELSAAVAEEGSPLALILIDVDYFKSVNDRYGHQQGDAILTGAANIIRDVAGTLGYPIRFAGDEFVVLLPGAGRDEVTACAEQLATRAREAQFKLLNSERSVQVTFSVGVAHYPDDTDDVEKLFENADHAAYIAKRNGRDRVVNYQAGVKYVLDPTTLYHYFPCPRLVARGSLVQDMLESLSASSRQGSPWTLIAAGAGVGKSRLLHEFRSRVDRQRRVLMQAAGLPYRVSQPFGLLLDAIGAHIRENPQDGQKMASALSALEITAISKLLPDLSRYALLVPHAQGLAAGDDDVDPYLEAFCKMLLGLGEGRSPCIVFDDFQWADQGTMKALELLRQRDPHAYVCIAMRNDSESMQKNPVLGDFVSHMLGSGAARVHELEELGEPEVREMVEAILPDAAPFDQLIALIHEKSQGVPLVVEEVLKFLIYRRCIHYDNGKMVVTDLPQAQVPTETGRLLEARAGQVDEDIRLLMSRAAVIGPDFDFSTLMMLEGRDEGFLRGIVERARKAHIISEVWSDDRDHISFISAQTHKAFYDALDDEERRKLHLKMARLRQRQFANTLDSALSELAFHFSRAGESDRAQQYLKIISELYGQYASTDVVVVGREEDIGRFLEGDLPEEFLKLAMDVARGMKLAVQNIRMYGAQHVLKKDGFNELATTCEELLSNVGSVTLAEADGQMVVNATTVPIHLQYGVALIENFRLTGVKGLTLHHGVTVGELRAFLDFMSLSRDELRSRGGLEKLLKEVGVTRIVPNEKVYVAIGERDILVKKNASGQEMLIKQVEGTDAGPVDMSKMTTVIRGRASEADLRATVDQLKSALQAMAGDDAAKSMLAAELAPLVGPARAAAPAMDEESTRRTLAAQADVEAFKAAMAPYLAMDSVDALHREWDVLMADLESGSTPKITAASKLYVDAGEDAIEPLLTVMARTHDQRARRVAAALLQKLSSEAADRVLFALHAAQETEAKVNLIRVLDLFDARTVIPRVEPLIRHPVAEVRRAALSVAATSGRASAQLLEGLADSSPDVRLDVIGAVGGQKLSAAVPALMRMVARRPWRLGECDATVQAAACQAMGQIGDWKCVPALLAALGGGGLFHPRKPSVVRAAAAMALAQLDGADEDARLCTALQEAADGGDAMVRAAAKTAIDQLVRVRLEKTAAG